MIRVATHSEAGGHAQNEDAFDVRAHPAGPACFLCAVADGQGGRAGGAAAAAAACRRCLDLCMAHSPGELLRPGTWSRIFRQVDEAVASNPDAGFTTLVALCVTDDCVCGVSNGDSAAALLAGGGEAVILTRGQPKNPPVGSGAAACAGFRERLGRPWRLLAMSDGVWKYAGWEAVVAAAGEAARGCIGALREAAALPEGGGFQDDFTLVVLEG